MHPSRILASLIPFLAAAATAQGDAPQRYTLKRDVTLGSREGNAEGPVPFNRQYGQLTAAQKDVVRSSYVALGDSDEPPFPLDGLGALYGPITKGQQQLLVSGEFRADAEIDAEGNVISIAVLQSPSAQVTKFVANILVLTRFKSARCLGQPCAMGFPVRVTFKVG
jgi:hypothetical protein